MLNVRRTTATIGAAALLATPMTALAASPASAAERDFRVGGAEVDFEVEKDDGRFEVEVDIDDAKRGSTWRVVLHHDGKRYHDRVYRANREGDIEIEKNRRNTAGKDVFRVKVKKVGGGSKVRTITLR